MTKQEMVRVKRAVIRKYPIFASVALFNVPIEEDNRIPTAEVWAKEGKNGKLILGGIKYNSDFLIIYHLINKFLLWHMKHVILLLNILNVV